MKIVVCMKQVPDTTEVKIDPVTNTLIRDGIPAIINPDDKCGIEAALEIKERVPNTTVTAITSPVYYRTARLGNLSQKRAPQDFSCGASAIPLFVVENGLLLDQSAVLALPLVVNGGSVPVGQRLLVHIQHDHHVVPVGPVNAAGVYLHAMNAEDGVGCAE